jgi:predicted nucleotidyltransferase/DNA-binding transcriptional ArsR family regulator
MITLTDSKEGSALFGRTRRAILSLLFTRSDESFYLREIVRLTNAGLGPVQRELKVLYDAGIIERQKAGKQVYFKANRNSPIFPELKSLIIKTVGVADIICSALSPLAGKIWISFIYGSFAKGTEKRSSDVDIMVIGNISTKEVVKALNQAQQSLGREINPSVYSTKDFKQRMETGNPFINRVIAEHKIMLIGNEKDLTKLG